MNIGVEEDSAPLDTQDEEVKIVNVSGASAVDTVATLDGDTEHAISMPYKTSAGNEPVWTTQKQLGRMQLLRSVVLPSSAAQGTFIHDREVEWIPESWLDTMQMAELDHFTLVKTDYRFAIQLNSNKFNMGLLYAFFQPAGALYNEYTLNNLIGFSGVRIDLSQPRRYEFRVKWNSIFESMPMMAPKIYQAAMQNRFPSIGRLRIVVLSPLRTGPSCKQSITLSIFRGLENTQTVMPCPRQKIIVPQELTHHPWATSTPVTQSGPGGPPGGLQDMAEQAIAQATGIDPGMVHTGAELAKLAVLDKPNDSRNITRVMERLPLRSQGRGASAALRLSLDPSVASRVRPGSLPWDASYMNLHKLKRIPSIVRRLNWKATDPAGTHLMDEYVNPSLQDGTPTSALWLPSSLCQLSMGFRYWRGSIDIEIIVVKSQMHTGRLIAFLVPSVLGAYAADAPLEVLSSFASFSMDLTTQNSIAFSVPYTAPTDFLYNNRSVVAGDISGSNYAYMSSTFILALRVQTELSAPCSTAPDVEVLVLAKGGADLEFAGPCELPRLQGISRVLVDLPKVPPDAAVAQMGVWSKPTTDSMGGPIKGGSGEDVQDKAVEGAASVTAVASATAMQEKKVGVILGVNRKLKKTLLAKQKFAESCMDLRLLLKRYARMGTVNDSLKTLILPVTPALNATEEQHQTAQMFSRSYITPLQYWSARFAYWAGAISYIIEPSHPVPDTTNTKLMALHSPGFIFSQYCAQPGNTINGAQQDVSSDVCEGSLGRDVVDFNRNTAVNIEVPYASAFHSLYVNPLDSNAQLQDRGQDLVGIDDYFCPYNANGCLIITHGYFGGAEGTLPELNIDVAAGDDFVLGYALPAPIYDITLTGAQPIEQVPVDFNVPIRNTGA